MRVRVKCWKLAILSVLIVSAVTVHQLKNTKTAHTKFQAAEPDLFPKRLNNSKIRWCSNLTYIQPSKAPIALVSFPGSGNTWLRYLLQQATGFYTGSVYKDDSLLENGFPAENVTDGSVVVVKTHDCALGNFSKAVLLIRGPGAAIQAEFNRFWGGHLGFAPPKRYKGAKAKSWRWFVTKHIEAWKQTNLYWLYTFKGPKLVIFYEDLVENLEHTLRSVIDFLGISVPKSLFQCALERREGIYRRKKRILDFDPFTSEMKQELENVQRNVSQAIYDLTMASKKNKLGTKVVFRGRNELIL